MQFLVLSSFADDELVRQAIAAGATGYLVKPLELDQMLPEIRTSIERSFDWKRKSAREAGLSRALTLGRAVNIATGMVMERLHLDSDEAFELIRAGARSRRRKLIEFADAIIQGKELPRSRPVAGLPAIHS